MTLPFIAIGALALTSCSGGGAGDTGPREGVDAESIVDVTPRGTEALDRLTWNLPYGEPSSLDPAYSASESNSPVVSNLCESLLRVEPDYTIKPNVATVEQPDDTTYVIDIDPAATFWDGSPVTPEDVIWSLDRLDDPELASSWSAHFDFVESIEQTGDKQVTMRLSQPDVTLYNVLSAPPGAVHQKKFAEAAGASYANPDGGIMCSGPFTLEEWAKGEHVLIKKNPDYWNIESEEPLAEEIRFTFNTDTASATTAMQNGEIDGAIAFPVSSIDQLRAGEGTVTFGRGLGMFNVSVIDVNAGPLANKELRRALALAIDYEGIREGIFKGTAEPNKALTPRGSWGYAEDVFQTAWDELLAGEQDIEEAKKIVEAEGAPADPIVFAYDTSLPEDGQVAAAVQDAGSQIGLKIELEGMSGAQYLPLYFDESAREGIHLMIWNGYLDFPEPVAYYNFFGSEGVFNVAAYSNPEVDDMIVEARATTDDEERAEMVTRVQGIFDEEYLFFPLVSQYTRVYQGPDITGATTSHAYLYRPWAADVGGGGAEG
ncbi:ABC transporter substrate-binding protein [Leucobacter sp. CSA1]|uniref:ABC transporter substrate-binding protein n=1 Tax=Leucobacter chromiisoli TaxID=2796471 RepID=A0A934Q8Y4_9MICO|nr:ABC transporter substrate-binding protein [Leucobacter chromiisoli]MBK0420405.1 ABC transporter substrate-binding protein [Leucobacter chromiisoli]